MTFVVHAPNVHGGGGKALLLAALRGVGLDQPCTLIADARLDRREIPAPVRVESFTPTMGGRLAAERRLTSLTKAEDVVLCMGNLPPLFGCAGHVSVFLQNRYLCDQAKLTGFPWQTRARLWVERHWLKTRLRPDMRVLVQTASMQAAVRRTLGVEAAITPFAHLPRASGSRLEGPTPVFLYPASGEPHKNHQVLLDAWRRLAQDGIQAELHLTVSGPADLVDAIAEARAAGVPVVNLGTLAPVDLAARYATCTAVIYPSRFESFGLPLLEANAAGVKVVAAERDYVRDLIVPAETFDPESAVSIARAVRRCLGAAESPVPVLTPAMFVSVLLSRDRTPHAAGERVEAAGTQRGGATVSVSGSASDKATAGISQTSRI